MNTKRFLCIIFAVVLSLTILFVFWILPIEFVAGSETISLPRLTWIRQQIEYTTQKQNDSAVTIVCPEQKPAFKTEDILCMKPFNVLSNYKNPCWYPDDSKTITCAPYFLQIGVSKCATTDLFFRLILHPDVIPMNYGVAGQNKSIYFWNLELTGSTWQPPYSNGKRKSFQEYLNYFAKAAKSIEKSHDQNGFHRKITGEGSPTYLWMLYLWNKIPQNIYRTEPMVLVPHLIRHILPKTKLIVTLRDPVERMYSSYHFFNKDAKYDRNAFHEAMLFGIEKFNECKKEKGDRLCILDKDLRATLSTKDRFLNSMYYLYIKEWLDVFPREQFIFIKMEDYVKNKADTLNRIFKFLEMPTLSPTEMVNYGVLRKKIKNKTKGNKQYEPMLNATRELLYNFYDPYTVRLPQLIGDPSFTWPKVSYEEYVQRMIRKKMEVENIQDNKMI